MKLISYALFLNCLKKDTPIPLDANLKVMTRAKYIAVSNCTPVPIANLFILFTSVLNNYLDITIFHPKKLYSNQRNAPVITLILFNALFTLAISSRFVLLPKEMRKNCLASVNDFPIARIAFVPDALLISQALPVEM